MTGKIRIIIFCLLAAVILSACGGAPQAGNHANASTNEQPTTTFGGAYRVALAETPLAAGERATLQLSIKNEKGETARNLETVHERPLHLVIVSDDLAEFYHEHPAPQPDGSFKLDFVFPHGGLYRLFADFKPRGANQTFQSLPVRVAGSPRAPEKLQADQKPEKTVEGLKIVLRPEAELEAGAETRLDFQLTDAASGAPVDDLENYLGARGHFVIIGENREDYVHVHPLSADAAKHEHEHEPGSPEKLASDAPAGTVAALATFPKPGLYKIWAQFQRAGKVVTAPFVVSVKPARETKTMLDDLKIPDGAVKIVVSRDGFTPQEITLKGNRPVKLAFIRTDDAGCAEVVVKSLKATKKLPIGEVVTIEIPKERTGEIAYACSDQSLTGKVVIE